MKPEFVWKRGSIKTRVPLFVFRHAKRVKIYDETVRDIVSVVVACNDEF